MCTHKDDAAGDSESYPVAALHPESSAGCASTRTAPGGGGPFQVADSHRAEAPARLWAHALPLATLEALVDKGPCGKGQTYRHAG